MMLRSERVSFMGLWLAVAAMVAACRTDPALPPADPPPPPQAGTLKLTLVPEWNGQPFTTHAEYQNFMGYRVVTERLVMYFGDIQLVSGSDTTDVKDVDLFRLETGPFGRKWPVAAGTYTKLRAGLGVPHGLNYADPAGYGADHPLSVNNGTYWTWAMGYRFVVFEGKYDLDPGGTSPPTYSFAIHPGMDPCYITFELAPPEGIVVQQGDTTELTVRVAVDRFFVSDTDTIDLATENSAHGTNMPLQLKLVNNVVKSFSLP